ncbi:hypothetical protein M5K25_026936 [Dendrobium thyrsiflorum]|uniref:Uncharacterized protein n=1 Tax=Dendrobium thyrsiflorum TaxID=117978 RepID=A0ABD0TYM5_DENTH
MVEAKRRPDDPTMIFPTSIARRLRSFRPPLPTTVFPTSVARRQRSFRSPSSTDYGPFRPLSPADNDLSDLLRPLTTGLPTSFVDYGPFDHRHLTTKSYTREEASNLPRNRHPTRMIPALNRFPKPHCCIASCNSKNQVEENHTSNKRPSRCWRHESKSGEQYGHHCHSKYLYAISNHHTKQSCITRRTEDIPNHKLPPGKLLIHLGLRLFVQFFVTGQVPPNSSQQNQQDYSSEERNHHKGVKNREPMHLCALHLQISIPPRRPADVTLNEGDLIGEDQRLLLLHVHSNGGRLALDLCRVLIVHLEILDRLCIVFEAAGDNLEANHHITWAGAAAAAGTGRVGGCSGYSCRLLVFVDKNGEFEMVEDEMGIAKTDADGITGPSENEILLRRVADRRQVFKEDINLELAEVFGGILDALERSAERERVVAEGHLSVDRSEGVHLHREEVPDLILVWVASRKVEAIGGAGGEEDEEEDEISGRSGQQRHRIARNKGRCGKLRNLGF